MLLDPTPTGFRVRQIRCRVHLVKSDAPIRERRPKSTGEETEQERSGKELPELFVWSVCRFVEHVHLLVVQDPLIPFPNTVLVVVLHTVVYQAPLVQQTALFLLVN